MMDLSAVLNNLEEVAMNNGGALDGEQAEQFERVCTALVVKVDSFALYAKGLEGKMEKLRDVAEKLKLKAQSLENHMDRLMGYADRALGDKKRLSGEVWELVRVKNPGRVEVTSFDALRESAPEAIKWRLFLEPHEIAPDENGELRVHVLSADKAELRAILKRRGHLDGAVLIESSRVEVRP